MWRPGAATKLPATFQLLPPAVPLDAAGDFSAGAEGTHPITMRLT
jgi:hypothetical protein